MEEANRSQECAPSCHHFGDVSRMWNSRDARCCVTTSEKENRFSATRRKRKGERERERSRTSTLWKKLMARRPASLWRCLRDKSRENFDRCLLPLTSDSTRGLCGILHQRAVLSGHRYRQVGFLPWIGVFDTPLADRSTCRQELRRDREKRGRGSLASRWEARDEKSCFSITLRFLRAETKWFMGGRVSVSRRRNRLSTSPWTLRERDRMEIAIRLTLDLIACPIWSAQSCIFLIILN